MSESVLSVSDTKPGLRQRLERLLMSRNTATALFAAAVASGIATLVAFTGTSSAGGTDPTTVVALLTVDLVLMLLLGAVVALRLVRMWLERRQGQAGSVLHMRLVMMFSLLAVTPAILVAVFAALFMNFGMHAWFSEKVSTAVEASSAVAVAYLEEHMQNIRADAFAVANDLNRESARLVANSYLFNNVLNNQVGVRGLSEAIVVTANGEVLARSRLSMSLEFGLVPPQTLAKADEVGIVVLTTPEDDRVRAVIKLDRFVGAYLLVGRFVDARVLSHIEATRGAVERYQSVEERRGSIQITFVAIFVVVALLLLLAAIWIGMSLANQLVRPIGGLIEAAEKVSAGDLQVRVNEEGAIDEFGTLTRAFNDMTDQLETQQTGLIKMNRQLDERRRFTETVLAGVSAGVIGLDGAGRINLPNRSASDLLETDLEAAIDKDLGEVVPEMAEVLVEAMARTDRAQHAMVSLQRGGRSKTLTVIVAAEKLEGGDIIGFVITFDDITELQSAQRKAAWSGVARRIAHEIKNPLTPIQLAAERLKRKYTKQIVDDPETFAICTDTIIRQVEDLGRMVDEFSGFARMPQAVLKPENLSDIIRQTVFLEKNRDLAVTIETELPDQDLTLNIDAQQIGRALTNLIKNGIESVEDRMAQGGGKGTDGHVTVTLDRGDGADGAITAIVVSDDGLGLPENGIDTLTEPYVTTRDKGTGLGLAIVKKIMEDHAGELILENREGGGARVSLMFAALDAVGEDTPQQQGRRRHGA